MTETLGWSRRDILKLGLGAVAGAPLFGCHSPAEPAPVDPHLTARLGTPTIVPTVGVSPLGLGSDRDGTLYVPATYDPATPAPLFVALHGAGGSGSAWSHYQLRAEQRKMILLAPDSRGATWDLLLRQVGPDVEFLDRALAYTFARCRIDPAHVCLGGFSDGASYALSLGASNGDLFTHLAGYSPGLLTFLDGRAGRPRVFVSHGTEDPVLPVAHTRDVIVPALRGTGYDTTYQEFSGVHEVPSTISEAALDWFLA